MSIVERIESVKMTSLTLPEAFREQIERAAAEAQRTMGEQEVNGSRGMDRSRDFAPVSRPSMVRSLTR